MRVAPGLAGFAIAMALCGCAPSTDVSGWEMARKKPGDTRLESFPEIPVAFPGVVPLPAATGAKTESQRGYLKQHDLGSLFRRGYSAPTP